ncbi:Uu.00g124960.m01.CDS01 [Anthostomella pinea]|uniref:Uu.00g124960.m01.CDS01 n=1 Tax=Anthostomella pinea TaxID=933095 RepID=A0AAI8YHS7_9PEZI|nr:Uu.00g124960.m01.CDS01 [Anthostomella pinea]
MTPTPALTLFGSLPPEVIQEIMKQLNLESLTRLTMTSRHFLAVFKDAEGVILHGILARDIGPAVMPAAMIRYAASQPSLRAGVLAKIPTDDDRPASYTLWQGDWDNTRWLDLRRYHTRTYSLKQCLTFHTARAIRRFHELVYDRLDDVEFAPSRPSGVFGDEEMTRMKISMYLDGEADVWGRRGLGGGQGKGHQLWRMTDEMIDSRPPFQIFQRF